MVLFVSVACSAIALAASAIAGGSYTYERLDRDKAVSTSESFSPSPT